MTSLMRPLGRLFAVKTKFEAFLVVYALALGACERGAVYLDMYPGTAGHILALCCTASVFLAGGLMIDAVDLREQFGV